MRLSSIQWQHLKLSVLHHHWKWNNEHDDPILLLNHYGIPKTKFPPQIPILIYFNFVLRNLLKHLNSLVLNLHYELQCIPVITWLILSKYSQLISHSSPMRVSYGMYFVNLQSELCSTCHYSVVCKRVFYTYITGIYYNRTRSVLWFTDVSTWTTWPPMSTVPKRLLIHFYIWCQLNVYMDNKSVDS